MRRSGMPYSNHHYIVSGVILGVLVVIGIGLFWVQSRFDPATWRAQASSDGEIKAVSATPESIHPNPSDHQNWAVVKGLSPLAAWEPYDSETLSDKIDGKAELYLSAGFERLDTRRFALTEDLGRWMEAFVYSMASYPNAFAVFSQQQRDSKQILDLTSDAYRAGNGLFMVHGPYYLEIIASEASEPVQAAMERLAHAFVAAHPVAHATRDERSLFPQAGLSADSIALIPANAFGFEQLDRIYSAHYQLEGQEATAFLSLRASEAQAAELAQAYADFLVTYGGRLVDSPSPSIPMHIVDVFGTYDIVFSQKAYLAGVHEAGTIEQALALAQQLHRSLSGERP